MQLGAHRISLERHNELLNVGQICDKEREVRADDLSDVSGAKYKPL
jgi:hypothetical protein